MEKFADNPHAVWVSLAGDGISNPQRLTAYGHGLDCWYLIEGE